jgi:Alpha galactosidase C-terminal beta sandwich domain/Immunoglobulin I-set domain
VFLNGDDLASAAGQNLAQTCLTHGAINEVARSGEGFRPVEGNTGTNATDVFVRQDGGTWYVAVFNYSPFSVMKSLNLARLGISGNYVAQDLWSGAVSAVSGTTWYVNLGSRQAKLFRLGTGTTSAVGPTNQALVVGNSVAFATVASGAPPFSYVWKKNGAVMGGQTGNSITLNPVDVTDAGTYAVEVTGGNGSVTNSAVLTLLSRPNLTTAYDGANLILRWPPGCTGWILQTQTESAGVAGTNWSDMVGSGDTNQWIVSTAATQVATFFRLTHP